MRSSLVIVIVFGAIVQVANAARLPEDRAYTPVLLEGLIPRDFFFMGEYPILLRRHHYATIDAALAKRATIGNTPSTGTGQPVVGGQKTAQPIDNKMQTFGQSKAQTASIKNVTGGNQQYGQQKTVQNNMPGNTYGVKQTSTNEMVSPTKNGNTNGVPGADYYNKQKPTVQNQLKTYCDTSIHTANTHQEEVVFTNPTYNSQTDEQVANHLSQQCYSFQDKTLPQYSNKACGDFNNDKTMPKCSGEFYGGRIPGTSGSNSVYSASCEINKVSSPKYFGSISDNERNRLITNVNGDHAKLTNQFVESQKGYAPYTGSVDFCKNVPPP